MSKQPNKSLPTSVLIVTAKWIWQTLWKTMMSQLAPNSKEGSYQRPSSQFRHRISQEKDAIYFSEAGRYRLYVGMSCPWAHRTLIVRALKGLENAIAVTIVVPSVNQGGWLMTEASENCLSLKQLYQLSQNNYQGRCTVPVLWDTKTKTIVNNESADIIVILNEQFNQFASNSDLNLYPEELRPEIELWNEKIYHHINNGVYRCGFAQTQSAYEEACRGLFKILDEIELHLQDHAYLCGEQITLADVRLFTTLIRFDLVYYSLFKCSIKRISDYPNLKRYLNQINNLPKIQDTYDVKAIKQDYFGNLFPLNPSGIIPLTNG